MQLEFVCAALGNWLALVDVELPEVLCGIVVETVDLA